MELPHCYHTGQCEFSKGFPLGCILATVPDSPGLVWFFAKGMQLSGAGRRLRLLGIPDYNADTLANSRNLDDDILPPYEMRHRIARMSAKRLNLVKLPPTGPATINSAGHSAVRGVDSNCVLVKALPHQLHVAILRNSKWMPVVFQI